MGRRLGTDQYVVNYSYTVFCMSYCFQDVMLDDDTLLNKPQLTNPENNVEDKLTSLHLAAILAVW